MTQSDLPRDAEPGAALRGLHHFAWRCRDAEETRHFTKTSSACRWHVVKEERVPSTGEYCPFVHLFFEFADHSHIAFFDLGDNGVSVRTPPRRAGSITSPWKSRTKPRWKPCADG